MNLLLKTNVSTANTLTSGTAQSVPKFIRWKHILVDGLTLHSEAIFPTLPVKPGDKVVDAGCGFGDTAIKLARLVGPSGSVLAVDCCDAFLEFGRKDAKAVGIANINFLAEDVNSSALLNLFTISAFLDLARSSLNTP